MTTDLPTDGTPPIGTPDGRSIAVDVALGRRVMVIGDLLLSVPPSPSSRAACRDIAQNLSEWQGPGIVVLCGALTGVGAETSGAAGALAAHGELTAALAAFARRPDSRVIAVGPPSGSG